MVAVRKVGADVPELFQCQIPENTELFSEIVIPITRLRKGIRMLCGARARMVHLGSTIFERAFSVHLRAPGIKIAETFL